MNKLMDKELQDVYKRQTELTSFVMEENNCLFQLIKKYILQYCAKGLSHHFFIFNFQGARLFFKGSCAVVLQAF